MTYNQVIKRIKTICTAHKQVRTFKKGLTADFLADKSIPYPAVFLQDNAGSINPDTNNTVFNFRMFFLDLVHVSEETGENEDDAISDMISVAMDIIAQMSYPGYYDWQISGTNNMQIVTENDGDMNAGIYVDLSVSIIYDQNVCAVPTTFEFNGIKIIIDADGTHIIDSNGNEILYE